ncbi:hypothetical protein Cycma_2027 [Cyclobacterium marinum DSM 745]|uniref:Uncharacterized protein n=1 Tax=Cyclobacterium marinum (strain ATCC 25205 / DSM 745 / LMG 13164 / NCIMB 1802) TaxID=880070 RepID=G0J125_CYCMS|nr:hypothetical protein Cycma_2027 [Cyclobacterium marinum DSM 745]
MQRIYLLLAVVTLSGLLLSCKSQQGNELLLEVKQLDKSYENLFVFYANLYDPVTGGFYDSPEKKTAPRIESTCRVISRIDDNGLTNTVPDSLKQRWVTFLQAFQNAETGFFDDPNEHRNIDMRRGRALGYVKGAFRRLEASSKYPYPSIKSNKDAEEDGLIHLKSVDNFNDWLNTLGWEENPWKAGGTLSAQGNVIGSLESPLQEQIVEAMFDFLATNQNENGFWGGSSLYVQLSGAFKVSTLYSIYGRQMPNAKSILKSTLKCIREEKCINSTWVRNPLNLLAVIKPYVGISEKEKNEIIKISIDNVLQFSRNDGGFANSVKDEYGTTDGCSQAIITRNALRDWVGLEPLIIPNTDSFLRTLGLAQKM